MQTLVMKKETVLNLQVMFFIIKDVDFDIEISSHKSVMRVQRYLNVRLTQGILSRYFEKHDIDVEMYAPKYTQKML